MARIDQLNPLDANHSHSERRGHVRHVVIVGGGLDGWITAGVLAARFKSRDAGGLRITLIEPPTVAAIGMGEGTWPYIRETLQALKIEERDVLQACDATFKQASYFRDWLRPGHGYYHPFTPPQGNDAVSLADAWLNFGLNAGLDHSSGPCFADFVSFQTAICDQHRAPKALATTPYDSIADYAYHLDAGKFAAFLKSHCINTLGVAYIAADLLRVRADADGFIEALGLDAHPDISGDLFIDGTGAKARLIGEHYGVSSTPVSDELLVDTLLTAPISYDTSGAPIPSCTIATAQPAGWIWDIGLQSRRAVGYAYASDFGREDEARALLALYTRNRQAAEQARKININAGYRKQMWIKNCVAIGRSCGGVEPLEASAIAMIELAVKDLVEQMPATRADMAALEPRFNERFCARWRAIVDFLKLHYVLSRRDEPFWRANRDPWSTSAWLKGQLQLWLDRVPAGIDFPRGADIFSAASYQYVLYGMSYDTRRPPWRDFDFDRRRALLARDEVEQTRLSVAQLPTNRAYFEALKDQAVPLRWRSAGI